MKPFMWLMPFIDVFAVLMLIFLVISRLEVAAIKQIASPPKASLSTHALYVLKVEWSGQSLDDVDTYLRDPLKNICFFRRLSAGLMRLDHDDTGKDSNEIKLPNGETVTSAFNSEMISIMGIAEGEYVANVHLYTSRDAEPVKVDVGLYKTTANDSVKVHDEAVTLKDRGDEVTAFRFTLDRDGNVYNINRLQIKFVGASEEGETAP
jgi:hypothetical protein